MTNPYSAPSVNSDQAPSGDGTITEAMMHALRGTKGWVRLIGVCLLIFAAFSVFAALAMIAGTSMAGSQNGALPAAALAGITGMYILFAVIYVLLAVYLLKYASAIGRLMIDGQAESMEVALQSQQKFWRLSGIMVLVGIVVTVLGIAAAIIIPIMASKSGGIVGALAISTGA